MRISWGAFGVTLSASLSLSSVAFAQDAGDMATARALGTEGLRLAESGNCEAAVEKLGRAEKLFHAPTTLERLGECQVKLGRYVEGTENLRRVTHERLQEGAPSAFAAAQTRAKEVLESALPHLARLRVEVSGPLSGDVVLRIDGQAVSAASIGNERPIDPGAHVIEARAPGYKPAQARVQVAEGKAESVSLSLEKDLSAPNTELATVPDHKTHIVRSYAPAAVAFGFAGAGLVLGSIFGGVAVAKKNDLVAACGGTSCSGAERGKFDDLSTFATVSTVGFVIAGLAAATGVVLFIVAPKRIVVDTVAIAPSLGGASLIGTF